LQPANPHLAFPVSKEQQEVVNKYVSDQLQHKCIRVIEFYRTEGDQIRLIEEVKNTALSWGEVGLALGSMTFFYGKIAVDFFAPPQVSLTSRILTPFAYMFAGALGVGAVGAAAGGVLAATIRLDQDLSSDGYYQWRLDAIRQNVMPIYQQISEKEEFNLVDFCCPITHELIMCPYKAPSGRVYEKASILAHLRRNLPEVLRRADAEPDPVLKEEILREISPFRDEFFTENRLDYDWEYHPRLCERLNALLDDDVDALQREMPEVVQMGLQKFRESIRTPSLQIMHNLTFVINQMLAEDRIDQETADRRIHEIHVHYRPFFRRKGGNA